MTGRQKLAKLVENGGYDDEFELFETAIMATLCPAICIRERCDNMEDLDPDQNQGWCSKCKTNTMVSVLLLGGLI
jgi:hypothetical protein